MNAILTMKFVKTEVLVSSGYNQHQNSNLYLVKTLKERKQQYSQILYEIQKGKYIETISINGKLHRAPKKNVLGEYIVRPEHVQVGLDLNDIIIDIQNQESIIRELRRKERNILRILKKRADKYD